MTPEGSTHVETSTGTTSSSSSTVEGKVAGPANRFSGVVLLTIIALGAVGAALTLIGTLLE